MPNKHERKRKKQYKVHKAYLQTTITHRVYTKLFTAATQPYNSGQQLIYLQSAGVLPKARKLIFPSNKRGCIRSRVYSAMYVRTCLRRYVGM